MYQEHLASYLKTILQHSRNVLHVTWRSCSNVSGTSCKLLEEDVTTYQERLASYLTKMLQSSRNVLQVTWRRCCNVSVMSWKLLEEDVATYQETTCKLLGEDVATYQDRLASFLSSKANLRWTGVQQGCRADEKWKWERASVSTFNMHILETHMTVYDIHIYISIYIYIYINCFILFIYLYIYILIYFCRSYISSHWCATKGLIPWCPNVIHHAGCLKPTLCPQPRVPKSNPKGPIPPCRSPKPTTCPSPVTLKVCISCSLM